MEDRYVLGIISDETLENFALIKKNRPDYQAGLLNGIGGKLREPDDTYLKVLTQKAKTEASLETSYDDWSSIGHIASQKEGLYYIEVYHTVVTDLSQLSSTTDEELHIVSKDIIRQGNSLAPLLENILVSIRHQRANKAI